MEEQSREITGELTGIVFIHNQWEFYVATRFFERPLEEQETLLNALEKVFIRRQRERIAKERTQQHNRTNQALPYRGFIPEKSHKS